MSTAPWDASAATLRTRSHRQVFRATAVGGVLTEPLPLAVTDALVAFDEQTAPRVRAQLTAAAGDLEQLEALAGLDPRSGVRVVLEAGYVLEGGVEDAHQLADLGLRKVTVSRPSSTARLELSSDEALVVDASVSLATVVTAVSHGDAIGQLVKQCINPAPRVVVTVSSPAVTLDPVTDRWGSIADLADRIGAKAYDDGSRTWRIDAVPDATAAPILTLEGGAGGTLTDSTDDLDRDAWANYVVLEYQWRDSAGTDKRVVASAYIGTGPYAITGDAGKRIAKFEREVPTTQAEANAAAAEVLRRQFTRSNGQSVSAVAAYWLRPGHTVTTKTVAGDSDKLVSRVAYRWPSGLMDVTTRRPDRIDPTIDTPPAPETTTPPSAPVEPDPTPPPRQTYTTTWTCNGAATYRGNGVKRTDLSGETAHGYYDGTNTNQTGVLLFTGAATAGDEVGKTITQALAGGGKVHRIRFRAYATHWWSSQGGDARLGYFAGTALPATYSSARPYVTAADWPRNSWRTTELTSTAFANALAAGSARGVTCGPGLTTSRAYYGKLSAAGGTAPQLELTYSR